MNYLNVDRPKIMVVDDHLASRVTAAALLSLEGYEVIEIENGVEALEVVHTYKPDMILLDVMMPQMSGFEVCRQLKQNEETRLIPLVFITALHDRKSRIAGIEAGADDFITKPFDRLELSARVKSLIHQKRLNEDLDHAEQVLFSIAKAVESRDPVTGDHCERLCNLGQKFGEFLQLPRQTIRDLMWGGYLHDIGKIGIPDAILLKPDRFTSEERAIMCQHVIIGENICRPLRTMQGVLPLIRHHHERWDGSGYPDGLVGDEIPLIAQVFQILDIYDALRSERPYKSSWSLAETKKIMNEETDKGWRNPDLVRQFWEFIEQQNL